jgi:hypothetical protein
LTLFIIPVLWDLLLGLQERIKKRRTVAFFEDV